MIIIHVDQAEHDFNSHFYFTLFYVIVVTAMTLFNKMKANENSVAKFHSKADFCALDCI